MAYELALHLGQFDMCTVATLESVNLNRHLLALKLRRDTTYEDHGLDALQFVDSLGIVDGKFLADIQLHVGSPSLHCVVGQFHLIFLALLHVEFETHRLVAPCTVGCEGLAVYLKGERTSILHAYDRLARFLRHKRRLIES